MINIFVGLVDLYTEPQFSHQIVQLYRSYRALFVMFMSAEHFKLFTLRKTRNDDDLFFSAAEVEVDNLGGVDGRTVAHRDC